MLKQRIITALILASVVLLAIFTLPPSFFFMLVLIISAFAIFEFNKLANIWAEIGQSLLLLLCVGIYALLPIFADFIAIWTELLFALIIVFWLKNLIIVIGYPQIKPYKNRFVNFLNAVMLFTPTLFVIITLQISAKPLLLLLLFIVWGADIFAYFGGKKWGKHRLAPKLSDKKTIQGVVAGLIGVLLISVVWLYFNDIGLYQYPQYLLITLIVGVFSVIGDLYASIYKRQAGVKDSGKVLPGHGGILDRIDSLLAAAPIFFVLIKLAELL